MLHTARGLQRTATLVNTLHHITTHCTTLHHTAPHHSAPHHTAIHYDTLQHTAHGTNPSTNCNTLQHIATHCNTLQHSAYGMTSSTYCNARQRTATHCNTLQHIATHCNTLHMARVNNSRPKSGTHGLAHHRCFNTQNTTHFISLQPHTHSHQNKNTRTYTRAYLHHFRERSAHTHIDSLSLTLQQGRGWEGGLDPRLVARIEFVNNPVSASASRRRSGVISCWVLHIATSSLTSSM